MSDESKYKRLQELAEEAADDRGLEELWWDGEGDLLDTEEGRAKFCQLNETSIYRKNDPEFPGSTITVFVIQGQTMTIKRRCKADESLYESRIYDVNGKETEKFYEPYEDVL